ncbi:hypothetical protein [Novacetimonas pomaceti]|uniref:hypothetical protein n=1 Tax=Novacetimonas pomaceti TaxID=2021998 RepID=UPI001C2D70DD|nr:hypothetical protein [Novacetimonas pomaceti]MBV1833888.1 hypothetical protein [Novacetimonas pomaceti]
MRASSDDVAEGDIGIHMPGRRGRAGTAGDRAAGNMAAGAEAGDADAIPRGDAPRGIPPGPVRP